MDPAAGRRSRFDVDAARAGIVLAVGWCLAIGGRPAHAQAIGLSASGTYSQNFDSLFITGTAWSNGSTLPGWYAERGGGSAAAGALPSLVVGSGSATAGGVYNFGATGTTGAALDRALGSVASASPGALAYGVEFRNDAAAGASFTLGTLAYTGEQWRNGGNATPQSLTLWYKVSSTDLASSLFLTPTSNTGWTQLTGLTFVTPQNSLTAAALDGNVAANRTTLSQDLGSAIAVSAGQYLAFRWLDVNDAGNDHAVAIDDFSLSYTVTSLAATSQFWTANGVTLGGSGAWGGGNTWSTSDTAVSGGAYDPARTAIFQGPGGTVTVDPAGVAAAAGIAFSSGDYTVSGGGITLTGSTNALSVNDTVTATLSAPLAGTAGFAKQGLGTLVLGGANASLSGTLAVSAGTLQTASASALGADAAGTTVSVLGGTLRTTADVDLGARVLGGASGGLAPDAGTTLTYSGAKDFGGGVAIAGAGTVAFTGVSSGSFGGITFTAPGTLDASAGGISLFGAITAAAGSGTATIRGDLNTNTVGSTITVASGGTLDIRGTLTNRNGTVAVTKTGGGTLVLGGNNIGDGATTGLTAFSIGSTTVDGGTVRVADGAALGVGAAGRNQIYLNYGRIDATAPITAGVGLSLGGRDATRSALSGAAMTFSGSVSLFTTGTVDSVLQVDNDTTFAGAFSSGTTANGLTLRGGGILRLTGNGAGFLTPVTLADTVTLTVQAGGSLASRLVSTGSGATLTGDGTVGGVAVNAGGRLAPGAGGIGTLSAGSTTFGPGGNLIVQVADATGSAGSGWDLLNVSGTLSIAATAANPFAINLWSLAGATSGSAANFSPGGTYTWKVATASGGLSGFAGDKFLVNTDAVNGSAGFANALAGGSFKATNAGNDLNVVFTPFAAGTTLTWYGDGVQPGGSGTWSQLGGTWSDGASVGTWDPARTAIFSGTGGAVAIAAGGIAANRGLQFDAPGYTLGGGSLTLGGTSADTNGFAVAGGTATISSVVAGTTGFAKTGFGTLVLAGDATNSGPTLVHEGTLQVGDGGTTGSVAGALAIDAGAAVVFTKASSDTVAGAISGAGAVIQRGSGDLKLTGANGGLSGGVTVEAGSLTAGSNDALGTAATTVSSGAVYVADGVTLSTAIVVSGTPSGSAGGTATLVAGWDFQTTTTGGTPVAASPSTPTLYQANFGAGTLYLDGSNGSSLWNSAASNTELNAFTGSATVNIAPGFSTTTGTGALALVAGGSSATGFAANGKSAVFVVDMSGKRDLTVSYATQRASTGFTTQDWAYSTDGTNWVALQSVTGTAIPTSFAAVTLGKATGLDDVSTAYLRMTVSGATTTAGNVRLDNMQFNAVAGGVVAPVVATATLGSDLIGGSGEFAGPVTLSGNANLRAAALGTVVFSGTISGAGGIRKVGEGTVVLTADERYSGGTTVEAGQLRLGAGGSSGSVAGGVQLLGPSASLVIDRSDDLVFGNAVSGSGGLLKEGGNTVTLTGSNSFSGGTTLFAGTLVVGDGGTRGAIAGAGPIDLSAGSMLAFDRSDDVTLSGVVVGDGTLSQRGLGVLSLTQSGGLGNVALRIESGVVNLNRGGGSLLGLLGGGNAVQLAGGTLELTGSAGEHTKISGATITVEADSTLAINRVGPAGDHVTTGFDVPIRIGGASTLTFEYRGAFSSNTVPFVRYKGTTTATGTVTLDAAAGIAVTNASGGTAEVILAGPIVDGGGGFDLTKSGEQRLTLAAANTYGGATIIDQGTLALGASGSIAESPLVAVSAGATFDVSAQTGGYVVPGAQTVTGAGTVAGGLVVGRDATLDPGSGIGVLTVTQGVTWASGGNLNWQIADAAGVPAIGWDSLSIGGVLDIAATAASPFQINLWSLASGSGAATSGAVVNFDATQNHSWRLATATGGITGFSADKFEVNAAAFNGAGGFGNDLAGGSFSVARSGNELALVFTKAGASGGPITIIVASGSTQTQAVALSGTTPVVKDGGGTLVLNQPNTLTGPMTVAQGTLQLADGGALASSPVTVAAGATLAVDGALAVTLPALVNNGLVDVGGGSLTVVSGLTGEGVGAAILAGLGDGSWNGTTGITSSVAAATAFRTVGWLDNGDGSVTLGLAAGGDTNLDGLVDLSDLQSILASGKYGSGAPAVWAEGDFNYDGSVDLSDLQDILASGLYDQGSYKSTLARFSVRGGGALAGGLLGGLNLEPLSVGTVAAVPEPSTWGLAAAGAGIVALSNFRQRRRHEAGRLENDHRQGDIR